MCHFPKLQEKELSFAFPAESVTIMDWIVSDETEKVAVFCAHNQSDCNTFETALVVLNFPNVSTL